MEKKEDKKIRAIDKKATSIRLEESILNELKIYCIKNNTSIQEVLESYVKELLKNDKEK